MLCSKENINRYDEDWKVPSFHLSGIPPKVCLLLDKTRFTELIFLTAPYHPQLGLAPQVSATRANKTG